MTSKHAVCEMRAPKGQRCYEDWELKLMKFASENNVTAEEVAKVLLRDVELLMRRSSAQGFKLKRGK